VRIASPGVAAGTARRTDLLALLDTGYLAEAALDVCREEPLPPGHPFWVHPRVWLTPHVAGQTDPESAARTVAENILRIERGEPPVGLVDRAQGY